MDDLPSKSTSYPLEYKGSTLPWLISCWERAILETMHDLFLLMLNLSQLSRKPMSGTEKLIFYSL